MKIRLTKEVVTYDLTFAKETFAQGTIIDCIAVEPGKANHTSKIIRVEEDYFLMNDEFEVIEP